MWRKFCVFAHQYKEGPARPSYSLFLTSLGVSEPDYVLGLQPFRPLLDLELHLRAFIQAAIPVRLDCRKMYEHVIAAGTLDESIALCCVKPLHNSFFLHHSFS